MPIQGRRFHINSGQETHQNFQATGSFVAFNPNDGIGLVALDRTATLLDYDHKLPSQSGGQFPGPINSYLSIYYVDQSGSGAAGEVSVYASPRPMDVPHFWSIGRALLSQVTSMDIIEGTQPGNPPAGTLRLWADTNGNLYGLDSVGNLYKVVDTNDALGGVLTGTLLNPGLASHVAFGGAAGIGANSGDVQSDNALIAGNGFVFVGSQKDVFLKRTGTQALEVDGLVTLVGGFAPNQIKTADLQANAITSSTAQYVNSPSWSTSTSGAWIGTPVIVNFTPIVPGSWTIMEWGISLRHSVALANLTLALGWSGTAQIGVQQITLPSANLPCTLTGNYWYQFPTNTALSLQLFVNMSTPGTLTLDQGINSRLFVVEQKR